MYNKKISISLVASFLLATNSLSNDDFNNIAITSNSIATTEKEATFSTEIYTKNDIEQSKSKDIYDFLNSQTSVSVSPNFGNTFSQKIDLRGYGIINGYQNIVLTVDGRRLNNIDLSTQLLSAIPLDSVESIEIIKGSGSVSNGDGANAGVINIITNGKNKTYIKAYTGNDGLRNGTFSFGHNDNSYILNAYLDYTKSDGTRIDSLGDKDNNYNRNKSIELIYFPTNNSELRIGRNYSNMNIKYAGSLTMVQYLSNPNQSSGFTEQYFSSYVTNAGFSYDISNKYSFDLDISDEDKLSRYSSGFQSKYEYKSLNSKFNIKESNYSAIIGLDGFNGDRIGSSNTTSKNNVGLFVSSDINLTKDLKANIGIRRENVEYEYAPNSGTNDKKDLYLNAYDLGLNYKIDSNNSIFTNYNRSFQAPDIDRFFTNGTFNNFIEPSKADNYSLGYNNVNRKNKLKVSIFYTSLKNEIYYYSTGNSLTSYNTNIDKSHKYGFELFNKYNINNNLSSSINYSYIVAKIDKENDGNGLYNGKDLPGVSNHNLTLAISAKIEKANLNLSHTYRSSAYAANDFENNFDQKQDAYNSTDFSANYNLNKSIELFMKVQNLFDEKNGLWIRDDSIYPVNFERTYYAGLKATF